MGNKVRRQSMENRSRIFIPEAEVDLMMPSVTVPSICTSPSYHLSIKKSDEDVVSEAMDFGELQQMYVQHEYLTAEQLSLATIRVSTTVLEVLKRQLGQICNDLYAGVVKMPEKITEKFGNSIKNQNPSTTSIAGASITKRTISHFLSLLYVHDMILNYFRTRKIDLALDLIKQVAVSHALNGVTLVEFRTMDLFIINYLIKNNISSDESINNLMLYLSTVSNYIARFLETQSVRHNMVEKLTTEKVDDRQNKARENYRLMKKWKKQLESFRGQEQLVDRLLAEQARLLATAEEEAQSIDTQTLKENDCVMKHFVKKRPIEETIKETKQTASAGALLRAAPSTLSRNRRDSLK